MAAWENLQVAIRVDASTTIGSGHLMRCLTLADALRAAGAQIRFVCREAPGKLHELAQERGFEVLLLAASEADNGGRTVESWLDDAQQTARCVQGVSCDWLVVDHYGLDARWEKAATAWARHILVVDDLANRDHACDLLLDQNLYDSPQERYQGRIPGQCRALVGPEFALLRPEFSKLRAGCQTRTRVSRVLASFGGTDPTDEAGKLVSAWSSLEAGLRLDLVLGAGYANPGPLRNRCHGLAGVEVHQNVPDMGRLMADADLALGAAGATAWERCCLGLPTVMAVTADNQREVAAALVRAGAAIAIGEAQSTTGRGWVGAVKTLVADPVRLADMSRAAHELVDGRGASRVVAAMLEART